MSVEIQTSDPKIAELSEIASTAAASVLLAEGSSDQVAYTHGEHAGEVGATLVLEAMTRLYGASILDSVNPDMVSAEVRRILEESGVNRTVHARRLREVTWGEY